MHSSSLTARWSSAITINFGTFRGWVRQQLAQVSYLLGRYEAQTRLPLKVDRLVFVCLGNINRSAFGAEVARRIGLKAVSIGLSTTTGAPATPMAIAQAACQGFSLGEHRATNLTDYAYQDGDLLIAMEARHVERLVAKGIPRDAIILLGAWSRPQRLHLHDPHTLSAEYFSTCFTLIESAVRKLGGELPSSVRLKPGEAVP